MAGVAPAVEEASSSPAESACRADPRLGAGSVLMASGRLPRMKGMEVMMIGLKRTRAAESAPSAGLWPARHASAANATMRMAFLAERPMMVMGANWNRHRSGTPQSHREPGAENAEGDCRQHGDRQ